MKDTKLIRLCKGLSSEDLRQIQKMLRSPFFTTNSNLQTLFSVIRSCYPDCNAPKLEKEKVFKKVFPKHKYSDIKLRNLNSELVRIVEDFLLFKDLNRNDINRRLKLVSIYKDKKLFNFFERSMNKIERELKTQPFRDEIHFEQMLEMFRLQLDYVNSNEPELRSFYFEELERSLDSFYLMAKSRQRISFKSFQKIYKSADQKIETSSNEENILLDLYRKIEQLIKEEDVNLFAKIKEDFIKNIHLIREKFQLEIHSLLVNYAVRKMAVDDIQYNDMVLDLYKIGLKQGFYIKGDLIADVAFFNIAVCASKAKDFIWAKEFINSYSRFLSKTFKAEILKMSLSMIHFHKKEYNEAIDLILKYRFKNFQFKTMSRLHFIRCYYELFLLDASYYDLLMSQIETNERFFHRQKEMPKDKLSIFFHFLNFVKKLAVVRMGGKLKPTQRKKLNQELEEQQMTVSRSWLFEIINK